MASLGLLINMAWYLGTLRQLDKKNQGRFEGIEHEEMVEGTVKDALSECLCVTNNILFNRQTRLNASCIVSL